MRDQGIIASNIKELLMERRMTQKQLARKIQTTEATVSSWLVKRRAPRKGMLIRIAAALSVTPESLYATMNTVTVGNTKIKCKLTQEQYFSNNIEPTETYQLEQILQQNCQFLHCALDENDKIRVANLLFDIMKEKFAKNAIIFEKK